MHRLPFTDLIVLVGALVDIARKRKPKPGKPRKPPRKRKPRPGEGLASLLLP